MVSWTRDEESALLAAVNKYRKRNWRKIIEDPEFSRVLGRRSTKSLNDKWKRMVKTYKVVDVGPNDEPAAYTVDILTTLKDSGLLKILSKARSGLEREEDVAELAKLAATKNIIPGNFIEVCLTLMKLMTHPNSVVVVKAIQAIGNLASDLKTHFSSASLLMLPYLLKNLGVEEPTIVEAVTKTLQTIYVDGSLNLGYIIHDVEEALENKVPRGRALILNWVTFCLKISNKDFILKYYEQYFLLCMKCLDDRTQEVRDAAYSALTALNSFSLSCVITCLPGSCKFGIRSRGCCNKSRGLRSFGLKISRK